MSGNSMRVYRYGLLPPVMGAQETSDAMYLSHRYYNTLIGIERGRRAAVRDAEATAGLRQAQLAVEAATETVIQVTRAAKAARSESRSRSVPAALAASLKAAKESLKEARKTFAEMRREIREGGVLDAEIERINAVALGLKKNARANCGVYWGTYLLSEDACDVACKDTPMYDGVSANDPSFRRWSGEGSIGVQIQGGMSLDEACRDSTLMRIGDAVEPEAKRRKRERLGIAPRTTPAPERFRSLHLRIGSNSDRSPMWAVFPMVMHRPLPVGAIIKRATVHKRMIGPREEWSVTITLDVKACKPREECGHGAVAVNFGWRVQQDGMRVAFWRAEGEETGHELALSTRTLEGLRKAAGIQAVRDKSFDVIRPVVATWFSDLRERGVVPEWARRDAATLHSWKSKERFQQFIRRWSKNRIDGDEECYNAAEAWRYHDFHLWEYERGQAVGSLRNRREIYRCFGAMLARKYGVLVIDDFDIADVAKLPSLGDESEANETSRSNRFVAAVSELRGAVIESFESRGGKVVRVSAEHKTVTCHACGSVEDFDAARKLSHKCVKCGAVWDQDDNNTRNLLADWRERLRGAESTGPARDGVNIAEGSGRVTSKWAKRKAASAVAKAELVAARRGG